MRAARGIEALYIADRSKPIHPRRHAALIDRLAIMIDRDTTAPELLAVASKAEHLMASMLCADGGWTDCPAADKRELLEAARAAIAKARS